MRRFYISQKYEIFDMFRKKTKYFYTKTPEEFETLRELI